MNNPFISSVKNELIKSMRRLKDRSARIKSGFHLIEGERLVFDALSFGVMPETILIEAGKTELETKVSDFGLAYISVTRAVLEAVSDTATPQGIIASVRTPNYDLPVELEDGLYVALDRIQDPGNMGTIIRTSDAMGANGIILGTGCTDPFSPKALRSSMGSSYHIPIYQTELIDLIPKLKDSGFMPICGHLAGENGIPLIDCLSRCLIIIGNEANGVSDEVASLSRLCRLPMYGKAESLNASVAASILIYEIASMMRNKCVK